MRNSTIIQDKDISLVIQILVPSIKEYILYNNGNLDIIAIENINLTGKDINDKIKVLVVNTPLMEHEHLSLYDFVLDTNTYVSKFDTINISKFDFINNNDGSIRWFYPAKIRKPSFLSFYSASTLRARFFVKTITAFFSLGLRKYVKSGSFTIYHTKKLFPQDLTEDQACTSFSVFTGTMGKNRKALFELNTKEATYYFVKFPLNTNSLELIKNEKVRLLDLEKSGLHTLKTPCVIDSNICNDVLIQTNINSEKGERSNHITSTHSYALVDLFNKNRKLQTTKDVEVINESSLLLEECKDLTPIALSEEIRIKLELLKTTINPEDKVVTSLAHVDFTPWNMYTENNTLKVYDWELANDSYPIMFDLFHYIFQSNILIAHSSYKTIKEQINEAFKEEAMAAFIKQESIDTHYYFKLYLYINVSYYLNIYLKQDKLHQQAYWLMNIWNQSLGEVAKDVETDISDRKCFIQNLILFLNEQEIQYGVLKSTYKNLFDLNEYSDIDLLIQQIDIPIIKAFINRICYKDKVLTWYRSNLTTIEIFFHDESFLSLDLVSSFKQKHTVYLEADQIFKSPFNYSENYYKLNIEDDFDYIINFYLLNHSDIPEKYTSYFLSIEKEEQEKLLKLLKSKYCHKYKNLEQAFNDQKAIRKSLTKHTQRLTSNNGVNKIKNIMTYIKDTTREMNSKRAFVITFSGVDGAGKTTVINEVLDYINNTLRKEVVMLRHRPSILPILSAWKYGKEEAENRSVARLPRQGKNKSVALSMIRFAYYYLDYMLGQFYVNLKYTRRGKIVVYDRYYFDFINDPRRTNLELPIPFTKALYHFLLKPKLNYYLYANADVILKRKKELSAKDIDELNAKYLSTFKQLDKSYASSNYYCIENIELEDTLQFIKQTITKNM